MENKSIIFAGVGAMALLLLVTISASAQSSTTGNITGTVRDQQNAAVANVSVVLSGPGLPRPQAATSDASGAFRFTDLRPGTYAVRVEAANGFESFEQKNVNVRAGKTTSLKIRLRRREKASG